MNRLNSKFLSISQALPKFALICLALTLAFIIPLGHLIDLAKSSDLYSHAILIPAICLYLAWDKGRADTFPLSEPNRKAALVPVAVGIVSLAIFLSSDANPTDSLEIEDYLAPSILSFACFLIAGTLVSFGYESVKKQFFPILFILFIVPFPVFMREGIQSFFQHSSAELAYWFIKIAGVPIFREGLLFHMPTIVMEVAPQCSGLRSSLVLFIVSTVASYLFLKSPWKRSVFVLLVIPIGIFRNAIRILILALQCYHIGPEQIDGWFHRQGGQPLFAVTLIPLFATLYFFWRSEKKQNKAES